MGEDKFGPKKPGLTNLANAWRNNSRVRNRELSELLYQEVYKDLENIALKLCRSSTVDARDLVQELVLKWESGGRLSHEWKNRAHFFATVRVALRNLHLDGHRHRHSELHVSLDDRTTVSPEFAVADVLLQEIGQGTPMFEKVLELDLLTDMTDEQLAEALGVSEASAKRHLKAARTRLRQKLKDRLVR